MKLIIDCLLENKIEYAVVMPDSLSQKLISILINSNDIEVLLCTNELEAISISSGLNIAGRRTILIMENSGISSIADVLTRLEVAHHIHNIILTSYRGDMGEANWWGISHSRVSKSIINELHIPSKKIICTKDFVKVFYDAVQSFKSEQTSVILYLTKDFFDELED